MLYAHRWFYILVILIISLIIEYYYVWQPNITNVDNLKTQIYLLTKKMTKQIAIEHTQKSTFKVNSPFSVRHPHLNILAKINLLINKNNLVLESMAFNSTSPLQIKLITTGEWQKILTFCIEILQLKQYFWVNHLLLQLTNHHKTKLSMDILVLTIPQTIKLPVNFITIQQKTQIIKISI